MRIKMTQKEWEAEGERRFGPDRWKWRFVCPVCGYVATPEKWKEVGASSGEAAYSCIGRHTAHAKEAFRGNPKGRGPCTYAGGGLFRLNPVEVVHENGTSSFLFAFDHENPRRKDSAHE